MNIKWLDEHLARLRLASRFEVGEDGIEEYRWNLAMVRYRLALAEDVCKSIHIKDKGIDVEWSIDFDALEAWRKGKE